jgi:hypothetical protein
MALAQSISQTKLDLSSFLYKDTLLRGGDVGELRTPSQARFRLALDDQ